MVLPVPRARAGQPFDRAAPSPTRVALGLVVARCIDVNERPVSQAQGLPHRALVRGVRASSQPVKAGATTIVRPLDCHLPDSHLSVHGSAQPFPVNAAAAPEVAVPRAPHPLRFQRYLGPREAEAVSRTQPRRRKGQLHEQQARSAVGAVGYHRGSRSKPTGKCDRASRDRRSGHVRWCMER